MYAIRSYYAKAVFKLDSVQPKINKATLQILRNSLEKRYIEFTTRDGQQYRSSYSYIKDTKFKPLAILNLPYEEDTTFYDNDRITSYNVCYMKLLRILDLSVAFLPIFQLTE